MSDVGIFRRKKADADGEPQAEAVQIEDDVEQTESDDVQDTDEVEALEDEVEESEEDSDDDDSDDDDSQEHPGRLPRPHDLDRTDGPFDESEVEDKTDDKLDLGALILTPFAGSELRLDVGDDGEHITGVTAVADDSAVQLQVFAAPKSSGVWDDIRDEIADNLIAAGGTAEEKLGELGIELHARMPARGEKGRTTYSPVRFLGVDGPRWFLRGVLSGRAAVDEDAAAPFVSFLRQTIVVRGGEARAPRELLELSIPQELLDQAPKPIEPAEGAETAENADAPKSADDFKPFERGPEITEVR